MHPIDVLKKDGKAKKVYNIQFVSDFIDEDYSFQIENESIISSTGKLVIFKLVPKNKKLPLFEERWDKNKNTLDIDMISGDKNEGLLFKYEKNGYLGHHPERCENFGSHGHNLNIKIPNKNIFSGKISFNVFREQECLTEAKVSVEMLRVVKNKNFKYR